MGTMRVDGRWGDKRIRLEAIMRANKLMRTQVYPRIDGFSVGNIVGHDPDNAHAQCFRERTAI